MITGRSGGSGKYSYRETSNGASSVLVAHMPEDQFYVRIVFKNQGETSVPIIRLTEKEAELLWASLKQMAIDLNWSDEMLCEKFTKNESGAG